MIIANFNPAQLRALNTMTKYPSIETFHAMGERGRLLEQHVVPREPVSVTEKIDGTNARIVLAGGQFLIGSREEWLTFSGDLVRNPQLGIVDTLLGLARDLLKDGHGTGTGMIVLYGEVYGGKLNHASSYTAAGELGFRLFDAFIASDLEVSAQLQRPLGDIAAWRDAGAQPFLHQRDLDELAGFMRLEQVPTLGTWTLPEKGVSVREMGDILAASIDTTLAPLDGEPGPAEGVVIRTPDRRWIRKVRFEDYRRTLAPGRK